MTKESFEMNACINFVVDGHEFEARQSRANPDGIWHIWHESLRDLDDLGVVTSPFENYSEFLFEAGVLINAWKIRESQK